MKVLIKYKNHAKVRNISSPLDIHNAIELAYGLKEENYALKKFDPDFEEYVDVEDLFTIQEKDKLQIEDLTTAHYEDKFKLEDLNTTQYKDKLKIEDLNATEDEDQLIIEDLVTAKDKNKIKTEDSIVEYDPESVCVQSMHLTNDESRENQDDELSYGIELTLRKQQWPQRIDLPFWNFSRTLTNALENKQDLNWDLSRELVDHMAKYAYQFKCYPNKTERTQICQALVQKYPYLKNNIGLGVGPWEVKLLNKLKKVRQTDPSLEVQLNRIKRKAIDSKIPKRVKLNPQKGEVNWAPDHFPGENEESQEIHRSNMIEESKKPYTSQDRSKIKTLMALTYSFRRNSINNGIPVHQLKAEYPIFFQEHEQFEEFRRLTAVEMDVFFDEVRWVAPKLLRVFQKKVECGTSSKIPADLEMSLIKFDEEADMESEKLNDARSSYGLLTLPYLLKEPLESFVKVIPSDADISAQGSVFPRIFVAGDLLEGRCIIMTENECLAETASFIRAVALLMSFYYTLNISYPKEIYSTLKFLQVYFLKIQGGVVPPKVIAFHEKMIKE